jgi:membrane-associated phospholipid phosphatase
VVGLPPLVVTQRLTGASRPGESSAESDWIPMHDSNGVSGHAFIGAFPWITAAKMAENPWEKAGWYFASTLTGWSRINDDAHYTSQVILGWSLAYLACDAVAQTERQLDYRFTPVPLPDGVGVGVVFER